VHKFTPSLYFLAQSVFIYCDECEVGQKANSRTGILLEMGGTGNWQMPAAYLILLRAKLSHDALQKAKLLLQAAIIWMGKPDNFGV
jgi:hypothetical protein